MILALTVLGLGEDRCNPSASLFAGFHPSKELRTNPNTALMGYLIIRNIDKTGTKSLDANKDMMGRSEIHVYGAGDMA